MGATKKAVKKAVKKTKAPKTKKGRVSKEKKAAGAKRAAAMKKAGKGIFAPKTLSPALAAICGKKVMPRTEVTKAIWVYIKKKGLNQGRIIKPDATLKTIFPVASIDMLKMAGYVSKHIKEAQPRVLLGTCLDGSFSWEPVRLSRAYLHGA